MTPTIIVADAETFMDRTPRKKEFKYSLRHMGSEQYVLDKRFQVHGWSVSVNGGKSEWLSHEESKTFFASVNWSTAIFIAHRCMFDASILVWRYGHMPALFVDTEGMANRFIRPHTGASSLKACSEYLGLPPKTDILNEVDGKRTEDIRQYQGLWEALGEYACVDNDNCAHIFNKYYPRMSEVEKIRLHWSVHNYVAAKMRINIPKLHLAYNKAVRERDEALAEAGIDLATARSATKFAAYLENLGVEVQYKDNKKGDWQIPALSKKDPYVLEMLNNPDPAIVALFKGRLAGMSSIEVKRAERLLAVAHATRGMMLTPTLYHAAHTGRPGGTDKINVTNFPNGSDIKGAIEVPEGMILVDTDASQIEARLCCWIANCFALLNAFADPDRDPYCEFASQIFGFIVTRANKRERQAGKVGILSLQYGVGADTFRKKLLSDGIVVDLVEAKRYVDIYRSTYPEILKNGREFQDLWMAAVSDKSEIEWKGFVLAPWGWRLPSGREMIYDNLSIHDGGRSLNYWSPRYKSWQKLYPGSINENMCQAMANDHVGAVHAKYYADSPAMTYDSVARCVPIAKQRQVMDETLADMIAPPWWASRVSEVPLPLAAEVERKYHW